MLSLTRNCHPTEPIPESRVQIASDYWLWVRRIEQSPKCIAMDLSSKSGSFPDIGVELLMHQEFRFGKALIKLVRVSRNKCVLRFDAPSDIIILREELL